MLTRTNGCRLICLTQTALLIRLSFDLSRQGTPRRRYVFAGDEFVLVETKFFRLGRILLRTRNHA